MDNQGRQQDILKCFEILRDEELTLDEKCLLIQEIMSIHNPDWFKFQIAKRGWAINSQKEIVELLEKCRGSSRKTTSSNQNRGTDYK